MTILSSCLPDLIEQHQKIAILSLNIPLSLIAFLGNLLIIIALQKPTSLNPASKLLFGCLACTDLGVGLITQLLFTIFLMSPQHFKHCYYVQTSLGTVGTICCGVSLMTLTAISVDRLLALMLRLRYRQVVTLRRVWTLIITFWLSTTLLGVMMFYNVLITTNIASVMMTLCTVTSTFCYTKVYLMLRHHQTAVQDQVHQGQPNGGRITLDIARYRKTVSSALWLQLTLVACYLPHGLFLAVLTIYESDAPSLAVVWAVTLFLVFLNSSLNPFLYCWKVREVRKSVKDTIRQFWCFSS